MYCEDCHHSATYHQLNDLEAIRGFACASWGCRCMEWVAVEKTETREEDKPKWNT